MDVNIGNPRVEGSSYKFEVQIKKTDSWSDSWSGLGNCDFYFDYNDLGFTGDPSLTNINSNITDNPDNYSILVQINGGKLQVKITYTTAPPFASWDPVLDTYEDVCTVVWEIADASENSGVYWDQINSGFSDVEGDVIIPTYYGSGDISLPVELNSFSAECVNNEVILSWITESEIHNLGFEVYRSTEETGNYTMLSSYKSNTELAGQGNSSTKHTYHFTDKTVLNGNTYWYKISDVDLNGLKTYHGPISIFVESKETKEDNLNIIPSEFQLGQNYPNPFNPETCFDVSIPNRDDIGEITINIFNIAGQKIKTIFEGNLNPGVYSIKWDGTNALGKQVSGGTYFYSLKSKNYYIIKKMIFLK